MFEVTLVDDEGKQEAQKIQIPDRYLARVLKEKYTHRTCLIKYIGNFSSGRFWKERFK